MDVNPKSRRAAVTRIHPHHFPNIVTVTISPSFLTHRSRALICTKYDHWNVPAYQLPGTSSCFNQFSMSLTIPSSLIWTILFPFSAEASLTFPEYPGQPVAVDFCRKYGGPPERSGGSGKSFARSRCIRSGRKPATAEGSHGPPCPCP